ncbi:Ankyrin repeat, bromo and BTB domain-containing protein [Paramyrothecium foliicola]|nr:Ankyrin repeat, bromo and BTB domain-containing protein [Paramyrothecium foliicola]
MSEKPAANGVQDTPNPTDPERKLEEPKFSWLQPHPIFAIILVGPQERPFGIQKDFLCARSAFYRKYFEDKKDDEKIEHILKLEDASTEVFGLTQNYLYTGNIIADASDAPSYETLVGLWKLGHKLEIDGLCDKTLAAMIECRRITQRIPATPLLIQVWNETPEGSSLRTLLLSWAAEYMRASNARAEFAKSLPQEVLSELVVAMSSFDSVPVVHAPADSPPAASPSLPRKNVHYLEETADEAVLGSSKRPRQPLSSIQAADPITDPKHALGRKAFRNSLSKPQKRRSSAAQLDPRAISTSQKLDFCADLLQRMLSGPGFWTRLVGPFREPVEPMEDGVPDYFDKVKRPMDLNSIKAKMDRREYVDDEEFLADMRQIFENCFLYWKKGDPMWLAGEKLQKTFEEKYSHMTKWISKMAGDEGE